MNVTCICIKGENAIISAEQFDYLCRQSEKVAKLEKVVDAAVNVVRWDWHDIDEECVADIARLEEALDAL